MWQPPASDQDVWTPPDTDKDVPEGYFSKTAKNILPDLKQTATGLGSMVKEAAFDMPKRALESGVELASGTPWAETPSGVKGAEFVKNAPEMGKEMARPITHPIDYLQEHPVQQTLNALGAAGAIKGMVPGEKPPVLPPEVENVPQGTLPETVPMRTTPEPPAQPASRGLPVVEQGAKTGDPHAVFAYNDKFGPGGTERSIYNVFGDPEHPVIKQRGWGSSVPKEELDKLGIPVTGRAKGSEKFEPIGQESPKPAAATPPANPVQEAKDYVNSAIPKAKEFLSKQYAKQAKDPGWANTMAQYLQQESQNLAAKEIGASAKHVRQIGEEGVQALGQYAIDKKIVDPRVGPIGMKERTNAINKTAGDVIGQVRKKADASFHPLKHQIDVLQPVKQSLDADFEPGMPGAHEYQTALKIVEKSDPSPSGVAEMVTKLNRMANENNKLKQPSRPYTDVANIASRLNNERIKGIVGDETYAIYDEALKDFGATKKLQEFLKNKSARSMGRSSAGSLTNRLTQEFLDSAGYKAGSRITGGMAKAIKGNPKIAGSLPDMFKEFINQVEALDDEASPPGMAHGGVVPDIDDAISHHLRKEKDPAYQKWLAGQ